MNTTNRNNLLRFGAFGTATATVINAAIFGLGRAAGIDFIASRSAMKVEPIGLGDVIFISIAGMVIGIVAAVIVGRFRPRRLAALQRLAAALALISTWGDFTIPASATAKALLIAMHLVVGATYVAVVRKSQARATTSLPQLQYVG